MAKDTRYIRNGNLITAITPGAPAVIETDAILAKIPVVFDGGATDSKTVKDLKDPDIQSKEWIEWGDNDSFPNDLMTQLGFLGVGKAALESNADMHYSSGIRWFYEKITEEQKIINVPVQIPDWARLCREQNAELHLSEAVDSLEYFYTSFIQFMWNADLTRINWFRPLNTPFVRKKKQEPDGSVKAILYSAKFPDPPQRDDWQEIPFFDPKNPKKHKTFVIEVAYNTWGKLFYPEPDYYTVFRNRWVKIATTVPAIIDGVYTNQATLKYHIKVPASYFQQKYKDWESKTEEEQLKIFEQENDRMNTFLTDPKNSGKSFVTIYGVDDSGKEQPGWVIESIKNYLEASAELPNNKAANYEILYAMNQDPTMQGLDTNGGGSNLAGSGSNKRQSRENKMANMKRARLVSLQIVKLVAQLNGYYLLPEYGPYLFPDYIGIDTSQTLDQNPTGKQTIKL